MTNQTQVLIDVALLERATTRIKEYEAISTRTTLAAELAALIPTDPMAEAREVLARAMEAVQFRDAAENTRLGAAYYEPAVEVIHTALNEPRPMTAEVEAATDAIYLRWNGPDIEAAKRDPAYMNRTSAKNLAEAALTAQFQPARKHGDA